MSEIGSTGFTLPLRVYYEDTDAGGVVYYANYLRYLERARTEWLRQLGTPREQLRASCGWVFVVSHVNADYLRPARLDDELQVRCHVAQAHPASVLFAQQVLRGDTLLLRASVRVACVDSQTFRPRRLPAQLLDALQAQPLPSSPPP